MSWRKFPTGQVVRIALTVALLVAVIVLKQRCGAATGELFRALEQGPNGQNGSRRVDGGVPKALTPVDAAH
jgi:hypothetical protein